MQKMIRLGLAASLFASLGTVAWRATAQTGAAPISTARATAAASASTATTGGGTLVTVPGMPPVIHRDNLYSEIGSDHMSPQVATALPRVYVPNRRDNTVSVIDPKTLGVVDTFKVGVNPQHIVPSWDLRTLWVANNAEGRRDGSLTPIDPATGKPGRSVAVDDPYNMYWTPDGKQAIVVAEDYKRLDFRDAKTMKLDHSIDTPQCAGINHADFAIDGRFAIFTCEFSGAVTKIDLVKGSVLGTIQLSPYFDRPSVLELIGKSGKKSAKLPDPSGSGGYVHTTPGMPQDIRVSPDGKRFFVADMMADGVHVIDGDSFRQIGFIPTGIGTHGLYPSRDGKRLYIANRGSHEIHGKRAGPGSISVLDFATNKVLHTWPIPNGGSPDMGNVSADGQYLWLSGRFDDVVYRIDTNNGSVEKIKVGHEPHGLTVWPQPGRYSLGHTGNLR